MPQSHASSDLKQCEVYAESNLIASALTYRTLALATSVILRLNRSQSILSLMNEAIEEAKSGLADDGIPIGSILIKDGRIVGRGHNMRVQRNDPMAHAEIECLRNAGRIGSYRGTAIYSTLMPCYLCAGAIVQFGIREVIAGESETFPGARKFLESQGVKVVDLDLEECKRMMKDFIQQHPEIWSEDIGKL